FSKEAVLAGVWEARMTWPFLMLALTAFLTAFYMFRVVFIAFFGRALAPGHRHEAPWLMRGPLWLLAVLTVLVGLRLGLAGDAARRRPRAAHPERAGAGLRLWGRLRRPAALRLGPVVAAMTSRTPLQ